MRCPKCNGKWKLPPNLKNNDVNCPFCGLQMTTFTNKQGLCVVQEKKFNNPVIPDDMGNFETFTDIERLETSHIEFGKIIDASAFEEEFGPVENDSLLMLKCPKGSFLMGSHKNELGRQADETCHNVEFSSDFYIGKFPVTQFQYYAIMGINPSKFNGNDNPVENVSWFDAIEFCNKLNAKTDGLRPRGFLFALPTEAQWEYACRATMKTSLNCGYDITSEKGCCPNLDRFGWYNDNSKDKTHPVGEKRANFWGIHDMHGNVWEWCSDWYEPFNDDFSDVTLTNPDGPDEGNVKVCRGGCWSIPPRFCRSAIRFRVSPDAKYETLGFRVAMVRSENTSEDEELV